MYILEVNDGSERRRVPRSLARPPPLARGRFQQKVDDVTAWLEQVLGAPLEPPGDFAGALRDGQRLCMVINAIKPGAIPHVSRSPKTFHQLNNITMFLRAAKALGVPKGRMFDAQALHEGSRLDTVVNCLFALAAVTPGRTPELLSAESIAAKEVLYARDSLALDRASGLRASEQLERALEASTELEARDAAEAGAGGAGGEAGAGGADGKREGSDYAFAPSHTAFAL